MPSAGASGQPYTFKNGEALSRPALEECVSTAVLVLRVAPPQTIEGLHRLQDVPTVSRVRNLTTDTGRRGLFASGDIAPQRRGIRDVAAITNTKVLYNAGQMPHQRLSGSHASRKGIDRIVLSVSL
jgi:hypothetical protein